MAVFVVIFLTCVALDAGLMSVGTVRRGLSGHRPNRPMRAQSETPFMHPALSAPVAVGGRSERADAPTAASTPSSGSVIKIRPASESSMLVPFSAVALPTRQRRSMVKTLCPNC